MVDVTKPVDGASPSVKAARMIALISRVNINTRLALCFVLIIALMSVGTGILLWQSGVMRSQANRLKEMDEQFMEVQRVHALVLSFHDKSEQLVKGRNPALLQKQSAALRKQLNDSLRQTQTVFRGIHPSNILDSTVLPTLETIQGSMPWQIDSLTTLASVADWDALNQRMEQPLETLENLSAELVDTASRGMQEKRSEATRQIETAQNRIVMIMASIGVLTIMVAALLGFAITQSITRPLRSLVNGASALANGEFRHDIAVQGRDELAHVSRVFNQTAQELQKLYGDLRRSERELRDVIETIPTFAWTALPDGSVDFVNRHWQEYTGLSTENTMGSGWQDAVHVQDLERLIEKWHASLATGSLFENEVRFRRAADAEFRWFLTRAVPLRDEDGRIVKWYGISTDIEDRKRAEQEREQLRAELAHVSRVSTLGELAASIAHELKQPITAAILNAKTCGRWLKRDRPDMERALKALGRMEQDGVRASRIIDRLRSLYKKAAPHRELVDLSEIVHEMFVLLHGEANRNSIVMRTALAPDLPNIMADPVQLQQVFMNLMLNAIDAMRETGGELTIRAEVAQDGQFLISVSDTGVGLPEGKATEVFDAFFTTKPQGSGMGLAISRSIVESHGGRMWASSNEGRGATFNLIMPAELAPSSGGHGSLEWQR
jgi:PAS domain S-box-containing protein